MTANVLSRIFTIEIGDTPTLTFEAQNLREAQELCHEQWLKDDLAEAKSDGAPLWDGKANLRARLALPDESPFLPRPKATVKRLTLSNWTAEPLTKSPLILAPFRRPDPDFEADLRAPRGRRKWHSEIRSRAVIE
jgi:hypothetical protein